MTTSISMVGHVLVLTVLLSGSEFAPLARSAAATPRGQTSSDRPATELEKANSRTRSFLNVPQDFVVCTGWHALCSASPDCKMNSDKTQAYCDCMRVNETHIVATSEIRDAPVKHLTQAKCTTHDPCDVDEAPICKAINSGQYKVDDVKYEWVSTYSYRGWCSLLARKFKACEITAAGYTGDQYWALCDAAPCTKIENPYDPERPLSCQCRVAHESFVGMNDSCNGDNGGIMSSFPTWAWDFQHNTYPFPMAGYEYIQGACAPLKSDPWEESRRDRVSR